MEQLQLCIYTILIAQTVITTKHITHLSSFSFNFILSHWAIGFAAAIKSNFHKAERGITADSHLFEVLIQTFRPAR